MIMSKRISAQYIHYFSKLIVSLLMLAFVLGWTAMAQAKHLLVYGDSLSAAYGMNIEQGWAHLLSQQLSSGDGPKQYQVSNASISGETTKGGLARLELTLNEFQPDIVLLELGANDGLQGQPIEHIKDNLNAMLDLIQQHGASAVLIGISLPPSYGPRYVDQFRNLFPSIATQRNLPFIDFYREDFYLTPGYMQQDGLHPTAITQAIIKDSVLAFLTEQQLL